MKRTTISIDEELYNLIYKSGKMGDTPNKVIKSWYHQLQELTSKQTKQPIHSKKVKSKQYRNITSSPNGFDDGR